MTSAHPHDTAPRSLTARCPEDLLAVARVVLGFDPDDSLVLLTVGLGRTFHARVDLPTAEHDLDEVARVLVEPATRHRVQAAVMMLYTADHAQARRALRRVGAALERSGVELIDGLRVHDGRWYPLRRDRASLGRVGVPYDISAHPFVAQAVLEGRVLHGSRRALAATVEPDETAVALVEAARTGRPAGETWVEEVLAHLVGTDAPPGPDEAAGLLEAIAVPNVRDVAWWGVRRERARDHVRLWSDLVRRAPDDLAPHAAAVLGFVAWVSGDGALAWCAVDRARALDPGHSLARLVADLLVAAVSPEEWEHVRDTRWPSP